MDQVVTEKLDPAISIIIPCFNSGAYLPDALESIKAYPDNSLYEVIIIDDGSTDISTLSLLHQLDHEMYTIVHQENRGPAAARNTGIKHARGEYILFLDSDNKIRHAYIDKSIEILNARKEVAIVYGNPAFFGDVDEYRIFTSKEFDLSTILLGNYIDMCSVIRRSVWESLGGFDENRILFGVEDWDFWIRAGAAGYKFHYVNEVLFDYRIRKESLIEQASETDRFSGTFTYIYTKHLKIFIDTYIDLQYQASYYKRDQESPVRALFKFLYKKYFLKKARFL